MADDSEKEAAEIHKVDTVPPPPDSDAYSAPTKIGEISSATWKAMVPPVQGEGDPLRPRAPKDISSFMAPTGRPAEPTPRAPSADTEVGVEATAETSPRSLPRVYGLDDDDDDDDDDGNETLLHPSAKLFSLPPPVPPPPRAAPAAPSASAPEPSASASASAPEPSASASASAPEPAASASASAPEPAAEPRVPEIVGPAPNDTAWPFAASMVATPEEQKDRRRMVVVAVAATLAVLVALAVWLWR